MREPELTLTARKESGTNPPAQSWGRLWTKDGGHGQSRATCTRKVCAALQHVKRSLCDCSDNLRRKILAGREFKSLVQRIILCDVIMLFIAFENIFNKYFSLRPWLGTVCSRNQISVAKLYRQKWNLSKLQILAHWIFQYYTQLFISKYFSYETNQCKCLIYSTNQQILHRRKHERLIFYVSPVC